MLATGDKLEDRVKTVVQPDERFGTANGDQEPFIGVLPRNDQGYVRLALEGTNDARHFVSRNAFSNRCPRATTLDFYLHPLIEH